MEPPFVLRKSTVEDLEQVMNINLVSLPENYSSFFFADIYAHFPDTFIVADVDGKIVGYIMCRIESGFLNFHLSKKGHVISVAVLPEYRNKGVGTAILNEAMKSMASRYGAKECFLEVRVSNAAAINLYKRVGLKIEKTLRNYYSDGENAYIMSKKL